MTDEAMGEQLDEWARNTETKTERGRQQLGQGYRAGAQLCDSIKELFAMTLDEKNPSCVK